MIVVYGTHSTWRKEYAWRLLEGLHPKAEDFLLVTTRRRLSVVTVTRVDEWDKPEPPTGEAIRIVTPEEYVQVVEATSPAYQHEVELWKKAGLNIAKYPDFTAIRLEQLRLALTSGINIKPLLDITLNLMELVKLRRSLMIPPAKALGLLPEGCNEKQTIEIIKGLEQGFDVTLYNNPKQNGSNRIHELRLCMEAGINIADMISSHATKAQIHAYRQNYQKRQQDTE
jgi:hypothetical protein